MEWLLKHATGQQLDFLNSLARHPDFSAFVRLVGDFKHYNVYEVFNFKMKDEADLAYFRAAKVGEVVGLDVLIYAAQGAADEIKRRKSGSIN